MFAYYNPQEIPVCNLIDGYALLHVTSNVRRVAPQEVMISTTKNSFNYYSYYYFINIIIITIIVKFPLEWCKWEFVLTSTKKGWNDAIEAVGATPTPC